MLAFLLVLPAGMAIADDDCLAPMADWQPREAVVRLAARERPGHPAGQSAPRGY